MKLSHTNQRAFTIVELLMVIVIVGILAALVVVAYNGVQERARASAASSALTQAAKKMAVWQVDNPNASPSDLATAGISNTPDISYQYTAGTNGAYCITATVGTTSYYLNTTTATKPTQGGCAGHGVGGVAAITNLILNPSFESNTNGWGENSGKSFSRQAAWSNSGSYSALTYNNTASVVNLNTRMGSTDFVSVSPGTMYTLSAYVRAYTANNTSSTLRIEWLDSAFASISNSYSSTLSISTTPMRLSATAAAPTGGAYAKVWVSAPNVASGDGYYIDSVMMTTGSTLYNYADGNSANWAWSNTTNNSASSGPPL